MSKIANHPNPDLHKTLHEAAKAKKLDAQFIQRCCSAQFPPKVEGNASAYVNWNTTLSLLGRAPAKVWFAGVSKPGINSGGVFPKTQDVLRDDLSVGVYYWYRVEDPPPTSYFFVEAFDDILFIDVFNGFKFVAAFVGTAPMNVQIQGGTYYGFEGEGLWGQSKD